MKRKCLVPQKRFKDGEKVLYLPSGQQVFFGNGASGDRETGDCIPRKLDLNGVCQELERRAQSDVNGTGLEIKWCVRRECAGV